MQRSIAAAVAAALYLSSPEAVAVAQRTFVSTAGSDTNTTFNCSLVAPCRSFGSALGVTATEGEIVVLDSGGYGRVTIDKSVAIIAPAGVYAGISVFAGTNGVDVDGASIAVVLRGLMINGQGGVTGIVFTQGSRLYIEQATISNMGLHGIELLTGDTFVTDTTIRDNGGHGIRTEGSLELTVDSTRIERNGDSGMRVLNGAAVSVTRSVIAGNFGFGGFDIDSDDGSSQTVVTISESSVSQNATQGVLAGASGAGSSVRLALSRNTISRNGATGVQVGAGTGLLTGVITDNTIVRNFGSGGISAGGAGVSVTIANNAVSGNGTFGVRQLTSALLKTRSNNIIQDNSTDTSGTLTFIGGD